MATPWPGIVVRCTTSETGDVPRNSSAFSPDIMCSGKAPFSDPSILTDPKNYGNAYDNTLYIGWPNYLYVRGKNYTAGDLTGSWNLFFATPNILLYPYLWQDNPLATSTGNKNPPFTIKAGQIGASTDAFTWVPPDTSDHYCMIGIANTPDHGNPLKGVTNISDLAAVLAQNGNIAQRNTILVRGNPPQVVAKARYDQGSEGAKIDLAAVFENIPKGSSYTISSGTLLNGQALSHSETNTKDNNFKYAWIGLDVPAQWNTLFTWTLVFGNDWSGIPSGAKPTCTMRGEVVMDTSHRFYHLGYEAGAHPMTGEMRVDASGGPVKLLIAGSVSVKCPDVGP
jgi:hypothetical protein